jgi:hypothetical protein
VSVVELPLGAVRAVEDELGIGVETAPPALVLSRHPDVAALGALRYDGNLFGTHSSILGAVWPSQRRTLRKINGRHDRGVKGIEVGWRAVYEPIGAATTLMDGLRGRFEVSAPSVVVWER